MVKVGGYVGELSQNKYQIVLQKKIIVVFFLRRCFVIRVFLCKRFCITFKLREDKKSTEIPFRINLLVVTVVDDTVLVSTKSRPTWVTRLQSRLRRTGGTTRPQTHPKTQPGRTNTHEDQVGRWVKIVRIESRVEVRMSTGFGISPRSGMSERVPNSTRPDWVFMGSGKPRHPHQRPRSWVVCQGLARWSMSVGSRNWSWSF